MSTTVSLPRLNLPLPKGVQGTSVPEPLMTTPFQLQGGYGRLDAASCVYTPRKPDTSRGLPQTNALWNHHTHPPRSCSDTVQAPQVQTRNPWHFCSPQAPSGEQVEPCQMTIPTSTNALTETPKSSDEQGSAPHACLSLSLSRARTLSQRLTQTPSTSLPTRALRFSILQPSSGR
jgi:hypothetical protein